MYYNKIKQKKLFLIIILIFFVFIYIFLSEKKINNHLNDILCIKFSITNKVCLEEKLLFYDEINNLYYFPIDQSYQNKSFNFYLKNKTLSKKYFINNKELGKESLLVNYVDTINYQVFNNKQEIKNINLKFTNIPIVNISLNNDINDRKQKAKFNIIGPYYSTNRDLYTKEITIKIKGHTSKAFNKNAYRMEFVESDDSVIKINGSSLKENNDWAFDALYTDPSKIRNKLATDIWNLINEINNDFDSFNVIYLDLYVNNEYQGLYTLKNVINRKKLDLTKINVSDSGILLKAIGYGTIDWNQDSFNNINTKGYNSLEMQYPNNVLSYANYWSIILNKLSNYYKTGVNNFENINQAFETTNFLNYNIYVELIAALDNVGINNKYFSMKDKNSKIIITPWDMDLTFGLYYTDKNSSLLSEKKYDLVNQPTNPNNFIGDQNYINALKDRYNYLRKNGLNKETIIKYIDDYVQNIYYSSLRDSNKWYNYDIISETNEIKDWITKRFNFLDQKFKEL